MLSVPSSTCFQNTGISNHQRNISNTGCLETSEQVGTEGQLDNKIKAQMLRKMYMLPC